MKSYSLLLAIVGSYAHIVVLNPAPRTGSQTDPATAVCQGKPAGPATLSVKAGDTIPISLSSGAPHGGGGCQFSLACAAELNDPANPKFKTIFVTDKNCPIENKFNVPVPKEATGDCVLSWVWIPILSGQPEMYMNCMDIKITGGFGGAIAGPDLVYFNTLSKAGKQLHGDNAQNAPTLFEQAFRLDKIVSLADSVGIAKSRNFGIPNFDPKNPPVAPASSPSKPNPINVPVKIEPPLGKPSQPPKPASPKSQNPSSADTVNIRMQENVWKALIEGQKTPEMKAAYQKQFKAWISLVNTNAVSKPNTASFYAGANDNSASTITTSIINNVSMAESSLSSSEPTITNVILTNNSMVGHGLSSMLVFCAILIFII